MFPRFIARQLSCPSGFMGRVIRKLMNSHNAELNEFVIKLLDVQPTDRVLEIGFGGGLNLPPLISTAAQVVGLDRSVDSVKHAQKRFSKAVSDGRASFCIGNVNDLPFPSESFDKVCTSNTIYFWDSLEAGFKEIHRVLSPGGTLVVGFMPREFMDKKGMPTDIFTSRAPEEVRSALCSVGFSDIRTERPSPNSCYLAILATR